MARERGSGAAPRPHRKRAAFGIAMLNTWRNYRLTACVVPRRRGQSCRRRRRCEHHSSSSATTNPTAEGFRLGGRSRLDQGTSVDIRGRPTRALRNPLLAGAGPHRKAARSMPGRSSVSRRIPLPLTRTVPAHQRRDRWRSSRCRRRPWSTASVHARSRSWSHWSQRRRRRHTAMRTIVHLSDIHFGRLDPATAPPLREAISRLTPRSAGGVRRIRRNAPGREDFADAKTFLESLPFKRLVSARQPRRTAGQRLRAVPQHHSGDTRHTITADLSPVLSRR